MQPLQLLGAMRPLPGFAAVALAVALAAAGAGCGKSKSAATTTTTAASTPASWANGMCSSLVTWHASVTTAAGDVTAKLSKDSLQKAADTFSTANQKLVDDLKALGTPPTPGATKAKAALDELTAQLKPEVDKIRTAISGVSRPRDLATVAPTVTGALTAIRDDLMKAQTKLQALRSDQQWKQAFDQSEACKTLTTG